MTTMAMRTITRHSVGERLRPLFPTLLYPAAALYCVVYDLTLGNGLPGGAQILAWAALTQTPWVTAAIWFEQSIRPGDARRQLLLRALALAISAYLLSAVAALVLGGGIERAFLTRLPLLAAAMALAALYPLRPLPTKAPRPLQAGTEDIPVLPQQISYASGAGNYVELHTPQGTAIWRQTMRDAELALRPSGFVRVHRSYLVARHAIRHVAQSRKGPVEVALICGKRLPVSSRYAANLRGTAAVRSAG
jgi:hypothetical protein